MASDPAQPLHAATKQYVDGRVQRTGDAMTGALTLSADPAQPLHAATKQYVDAQAGTRLNAAGGTMTGPLTLAADPTQTLHAATKQYVDAQAAARFSTAGGTLNGTLTVAGAGQSTVQNGSLYVGNSDFQHTVLSTSGPQTALFNKVGSATTDASVVESYYLVNHTGGTGHVINNLFVGTSVTSTPADGIWGFLSSLTSSSGGGNGGATGHVAGYLQTVRSAVPMPTRRSPPPRPANTVRVADVTNFFTGYTAGVGFPLSAAHPLPVLINGNSYSVTGCTPDSAGRDQRPWHADARHSDRRGGRRGRHRRVIGLVNGANLWGGVIEYHEQVDLPSSKSGFGQTLELDWVGNNLDDADTRCFISAVVGKNAATGTDVEVGNVIGVWPGNGSTRTSGASIKRGMQVNVTFSQAIIDARNATQRPGANAVWLADGQTMAFSTDGKWAVHYNSGRPGLEFLFNGGVLGGIDLQSRYNAPGGFASSGAYTSTATVRSGQSAFDARGAVQNAGGNVVWLADGQRIALSTDGTHTIAYDNTTGAILLGGPVRFTAAPVLPSFTVAALPIVTVAGAKAYASNGRKVGEAAGGAEAASSCSPTAPGGGSPSSAARLSRPSSAWPEPAPADTAIRNRHMPTIPQLPAAGQITAADELPLSQDGVTRGATVGELLAGTQPTIITATGTLLGRISIGPGGPEQVGVGTGLALAGGALAATGVDHAAFPPQTVLQPTDEVVLNSAGAPRRMPLAMLRGLFSAGANVTIDPTGTIAATGGTGRARPARKARSVRTARPVRPVRRGRRSRRSRRPDRPRGVRPACRATRAPMVPPARRCGRPGRPDGTDGSGGIPRPRRTIRARSGHRAPWVRPVRPGLPVLPARSV